MALLLYCFATLVLSSLSWLPPKANSLPITSEPLASSPEHLTYDALLSIETHQYRPTHGLKVPKSIFITPKFKQTISCPPGLKADPVTNKCQRPVIQLDEKELLMLQALQAFSGTKTQQESSEPDEYDYTDDTYDNEPEGPYRVPLTVSWDREQFSGSTAALTATQSVSAEHAAKEHEQPFRANGVGSSDAKTSPSEPISKTITTYRGEISFDNLDGRRDGAAADSAATLADVANVVGVPDGIVAGSTIAILPSRLMTTRAILPSTTEMTPSATQTETVATASRMESTESVAEVSAVATTGSLTSTERSETESTTSTTSQNSETTIDATEISVTDLPLATGVQDNTIETTTVADPAKPSRPPATETTVDIFDDASKVPELEKDIEKDALKLELQEFSLLKDEQNTEESPMTTTTEDSAVQSTIIVDETSTDVAPTVIAEQAETATDMPIETSTSSVSTTPRTIATVPTEVNVFIVTPEQISKLVPTSTVEPNVVSSVAEDGEKDAKVSIGNESAAIKRQQDTVMQHELNEEARDTIDQHNRFVYAHLEPHAVVTVASPNPSLAPTISPPSPTTEVASTTVPTSEERVTNESTSEAPSTTTPSATESTTLPEQVTRRSLLEQLRLINRYNEENRRRTEHNQHQNRPNIFVNHRTDMAPRTPIRFPSSASIGNSQGSQPATSTGFRFPTSLLDQRLPPQPAPAPAPSSSLFSWLPANWRISSSRDSSDRTGSPDAANQLNGQRKAMNFWSRMPLIPDIGAGGVFSESTDRATRANSRSPSERLFRQEQASNRGGADVVMSGALNDKVFRVLTTKNTGSNQQ